MSGLVPAVPAERLWPERVAYMARTDLEQTRLLGYTPFNLDAVTTLLMGVLGDRPAVRHRSGATEEILSFLSDAGLAISERLLTYETGAEAEAIADRLVEQGHRLFWAYPLREGRFAEAAQLVPPALWRRLNSKERLSDLAPDEALAPRRFLDLEAVSGVAPPVFLKAAGEAATGWGYAVRYCDSADALGAACRDFRAQGVRRVIAETALAVESCWCANLAVAEDGNVLYFGAAEQVFAAPARQAGSVIDPDNPFPPDGVEIARVVASAAAARGFAGVCGLDIGRLVDGRLIVFDPNFRFNACTVQVLLHDAAVGRSGLSLSRSFSGVTTRPLAALLGRLAGPVAEGWFVPTRLLDGARLPAAAGISHCTGFVLAASRAEADARVAALTALIGE